MEMNDLDVIRSVLDDMSAGILLIGFDCKIMLLNRAASQILALSDMDFTGHTIAQMMHETEPNETFFDTVSEIVNTKKIIAKTIPFMKQNRLSYLRVTSDFLMANHVKIGIILQIRDMTDSTLLFIANKRLTNQVTDLMNSFVEVMVTAVEEKSAYNANHTKSMVQYAKRYLKWLAAEGKQELFPAENTIPFLMSIWLHDIGKLLIPQEIMDKSTRLGSMLEPISHRIETAKLMLKIESLEHPESKPEIDNTLRSLCEAEKLIVSCNTAGSLNAETISALNQAAKLPCMAADGTVHPLLKPNELNAITVPNGTLTAEERTITESHVCLTQKLLSKVEFRGIYKPVPKWTSSHHELLDGSGYPEHLRGDAIPTETRLLTILDIYDALTAEDRPYKPPLSAEKAFSIMRDMAGQGKIDSEILESFYASGAWKHDAS